MKKFIAILSVLAISATAHAAPPTEASINRLLDDSQADKVLDAIKPQLQNMMKQMEQQAQNGKALSAADQKVVDKFRDRVISIMNKNLTMAVLKPQYVRVYAQNFSQEEIDGMIAFYESPTGKAVVTKLPIVMQSVMAEMPKTLAPMMQEMQKAGKDMNDELAALHKQGTK